MHNDFMRLWMYCLWRPDFKPPFANWKALVMPVPSEYVVPPALWHTLH